MTDRTAPERAPLLGPLSLGPAPFIQGLLYEMRDMARALTRWARSWFGLREPNLLKLAALASSNPPLFAAKAATCSAEALQAAWSIAIGHLPLRNEAPLIALLNSGATLSLPARSTAPLGCDTPYFGSPIITLEAYLGDPDASQTLHKAFAGAVLARGAYDSSFWEPLKSLCRLRDPLSALANYQTRLNALTYLEILASRVRRGFGLERADAHLALALAQAPSIDRLCEAGFFHNPAWLAKNAKESSGSLANQVFKMSFHQRECQEAPTAELNWTAMASALVDAGALTHDELGRALAEALLSPYRLAKTSSGAPGEPPLNNDPIFNFSFRFFDGFPLPEPLLAVSELVALHESRDFERSLTASSSASLRSSRLAL